MRHLLSTLLQGFEDLDQRVKLAEVSEDAVYSEALLCDRMYEDFSKVAEHLYGNDAYAVASCAMALRGLREMDEVKLASEEVVLPTLQKLAATALIDQTITKRLESGYSEKEAQLRMLNREYAITLLGNLLRD